MLLRSCLRRVVTIPHFLFSLYLLSASPVLAADPFQDQVLPFLNTYCVRCHNKEKLSGDLDLTRYTAAAMMICSTVSHEYTQDKSII